MDCYDEWWLPRDMENMSYIFEYCDSYCKQLYGLEIDKNIFLNSFMCSNIRKEMETGHPTLLSQAGYDTVKKFVEVDCQKNIQQFKGSTQDAYPNQYYWVGMMYAYLHFETKKSSEELLQILPLDTMLQMYYLGHEQSRETVYRHLQEQSIL